MPPDQEAAVENVTPTASTEQAQQTAATDQTPVTDQPAVAVEPAAQDKPKNDWVQRRIDQLTREKHEEKRRADALEARLAQGQQSTEGQQQGQPLTPDQVRTEARRLLAEEKFNDACNRTWDAGKAEFPDFDRVVEGLRLFGGVPPDLMAEIASMDVGHKVLKYLSENPDVGDSLVSLPPLRQARELARIESEVGKAKAPPVSSAPAPITPVGGKTAPVEPEEFASTADYIAWKKRQRK